MKGSDAKIYQAMFNPEFFMEKLVAGEGVGKRQWTCLEEPWV